MQKILLILLVFFSFALAEISLSTGGTWGRYLETISADDNASRSVKKSVLAGRPAIFLEFDSGTHPLWLDNDLVVAGVGMFAETRYHDYYRRENYATFVPFYGTYYLRFAGTWAVGAGLNFNFMQVRYKNEVSPMGQQIGKHLFFRDYLSNDRFIDFGIMQTCAQTVYTQDDITLFYDATNFVFRFGWYLDKNEL